jgi:hypothetical protein
MEKTRGGARPNAGRKSVEEEVKVKTILSNALKSFYEVDTDEESKSKLVHTLMESQRGQIFIAEHLFGKPKETVETTHNINNFDIKELFKFDNDKE